VFELVDLVGEDGFSDAEVSGCVVEIEVSRNGQEPPDSLFRINEPEMKRPVRK
jgi:hypothetical protein